jgi:2-dehydro-3-deoxygalactonokinase
MTGSLISWAVALDGGTTNTRARLVEVGTWRVIATARRGVGVRDTVLSAGGGEGALERAVRDAIKEVRRMAQGITPDLLVAAGMLTSEVGLTNVAHLSPPAGLDELAAGAALRRLPAVAEMPIVFVPGIRTPAGAGPDGWASADVMRGEECETLGAWLNLFESAPGATPAAAPCAFLWPGSHTKLVEVDSAGRIVRSHTTLAGELMQALARHTLLKASLPDGFPDNPDPTALAAGARLVERDGLGRAAFLVRVAALTAALPPDQRAAFWVGAVVADDVAHLARHPILHAGPTVWVGGRQPLRDLYARLLQPRHNGPVRMLDDEIAETASAAGAVAVGRRYAERHGESLPRPRGEGITG